MQRWVDKWSKRECFEDKPRSRRQCALTNYAQKSSEYKGNNSTRKIAKNLPQNNIEVWSITVWRYMTRKEWKNRRPSSERKCTLLSEKQKKDHLKIRQEIRKANCRRLEQFLCTDEYPKYIF